METPGLGRPAPEATVPLVAAEPSPALSQPGETWPTDGRVIGIVADEDADLDGVRTARRTIPDAGMVPLVTGPKGGTLDRNGEPIAVQRTFATARSVEWDALLCAGHPAAGADAYGVRSAEAGSPAPDGSDPRVLLLITEAYRHGKAIGAWNDARALLGAAGIGPEDPGIAVTDSCAPAVEQRGEALARHRAWGRFPPSL